MDRIDALAAETKRATGYRLAVAVLAVGNYDRVTRR